MRLHHIEWGCGERHAVLIHGIMSDSRSWRRVGPALAERGYHVIAVDLRGHGASPRGPYSVPAWGADVLESVPRSPALAVGHSLGGLTLSHIVRELAPQRAVYCDPAFDAPKMSALVRASVPVQKLLAKRMSRAAIARRNPRWDRADVDIEHATIADWDPKTLDALLADGGSALTGPADPEVPSLVQLADPSMVVTPATADRLRAQGFEVQVIKGTSHTITRDDFDAFMASLDGWLLTDPGPIASGRG